MLIKELPESSWAGFLMDFAKNNEGKTVRLAVDGNEGEMLLGQNKLISFEGDCTGEVVEGVKIIVGDTEGKSPGALYHNVDFPNSIKVEEEESGTIHKLILEDDDGLHTIVEATEEPLTN